MKKAECEVMEKDECEVDEKDEWEWMKKLIRRNFTNGRLIVRLNS